MIWLAMRIAILEFSRGTGLFGFGRLVGLRRTGAGGDFVSLTLLSAVIIALVAFSASAGRGIAENVTQVMLGHIRGAGTPIWLLANFSRDAAVDRPALAVFANGGGYASASPPLENVEPAVASALGRLSFFPVAETEMRDPLLQLPADAIWRLNAFEGAAPTEFRGWVVDLDNPVWTAFAQSPRDPRTVVLNRKLFRDHFDYAAYRQFLAETLPPAAAVQMPPQLDDISDLKAVYLSLPFDGNRRRLVNFDVVWADNLPGLQKIAILIPYEIASLARAAWENPGITVTFEDDRDDFGDPFQIVERVTFLGADTASARPFLDDGQMERFSQCLGPGVRPAHTERMKRFDFLAITSWAPVEQCLETAGLTDYPNLSPGFTSHPAVSVTGRVVTAPCHAVSDRIVQASDDPGCRADGLVRFEPFSAFRTGLLFVPAEADIAGVLDTVRQYGDARGKVFLIAESYQDALARMDFTQKVVQYLTFAVGGLGFALCASVLYLQIRPLLLARAPTYGLLLARGLRSGAIYAGVIVQIVMTIAIGAAIGLVLLLAIRYGVEWAFGRSAAAATARTDFGLLEPRLIPVAETGAGNPLSRLMAGLAGFAASVAAIGFTLLAFALATLWSMPLRRSTAPVELIVARNQSMRTERAEQAGRK